MVDMNLVMGVVVLNDPEVKVASEFMCLKPSVTTPVSVRLLRDISFLKPVGIPRIHSLSYAHV